MKLTKKQLNLISNFFKQGIEVLEEKHLSQLEKIKDFELLPQDSQRILNDLNSSKLVASL